MLQDERISRSDHGLCKGFTLVELLVVISIIAVLVSLLLPALNKVRAHAIDVTCRSNLKQAYMAYALYADAYKGALPRRLPSRYLVPTGSGGGVHSADFNCGQSMYLMKGEKMGGRHPDYFICPVARDVLAYAKNSDGTWQYPTYRPNPHYWEYTSKLANPICVRLATSLHYIVPDPTKPDSLPHRVSPSNAAMLGEPDERYTGANFLSYTMVWQRPNEFGYYHGSSGSSVKFTVGGDKGGKTFNCLYFDGHVAPMSRKQIAGGLDGWAAK
jgi:prepilin-type N-terminal cleavage/methylation domain-containing protein/prepilin-type processing-associated H-X9-DG protein